MLAFFSLVYKSRCNFLDKFGLQGSTNTQENALITGSKVEMNNTCHLFSSSLSVRLSVFLCELLIWIQGNKKLIRGVTLVDVAGI